MAYLEQLGEASMALHHQWMTPYSAVQHQGNSRGAIASAAHPDALDLIRPIPGIAEVEALDDPIISAVQLCADRRFGRVVHEMIKQSW